MLTNRSAIAALALLLARTLLSAQQPLRQFEAVSVRPSDPNAFTANLDGEDPCSQAIPRLTGRRLTAPTTTLYALIALAYNPWQTGGGGCAYARQSGLIEGAADWIKSTRFALQIALPDAVGTAAYDQLVTEGRGTLLQEMLQAMLADRFRLKVRREARNLPVYLLQLDTDDDVVHSRMAASLASRQAADARLGTGIFTGFPAGPDGSRYTSVTFRQQLMLRVAQRLTSPAQRPVLDRTGLTGAFDFVVEFDDTGVLRPALVTALREQLGLRLQPASAPIDILVIERAERPTAD